MGVNTNLQLTKVELSLVTWYFFVIKFFEQVLKSLFFIKQHFAQNVIGNKIYQEIEYIRILQLAKKCLKQLNAK